MLCRLSKNDVWGELFEKKLRLTQEQVAQLKKICIFKKLNPPVGQAKTGLVRSVVFFLYFQFLRIKIRENAQRFDVPMTSLSSVKIKFK